MSTLRRAASRCLIVRTCRNAVIAGILATCFVPGALAKGSPQSPDRGGVPAQLVVTPQCADANARVARARTYLTRAKRTLARSHAPATRRKARKQIEKAKKALAAALTARTEACANHPPVFPTPMEFTVNTSYEYDSAGRLYGGVTTIAVTTPASDPDGDSITYAWSASNGDISGNGLTASWTRVMDYGQFMPGLVTLTASDGRGGSTPFTFDFK